MTTINKFIINHKVSPQRMSINPLKVTSVKKFIYDIWELIDVGSTKMAYKSICDLTINEYYALERGLFDYFDDLGVEKPKNRDNAVIFVIISKLDKTSFKNI